MDLGGSVAEAAPLRRVAAADAYVLSDSTWVLLLAVAVAALSVVQLFAEHLTFTTLERQLFLFVLGSSVAVAVGTLVYKAATLSGGGRRR